MNTVLIKISILEWGGILLFLLWTLLTFVFQFTGSKVRAFQFWAYLGLLPYWSFFAPQPPTSDYHLLYRDHLADGTVLPWREVQPEKHQWWRPLWNPQMRQTKALSDVIGDLNLLVNPSVPPWLEVSVPYLLLLHTITNCSHIPTTCSVQFLILNSPGGLSESEPEVLFLSHIHPLGQVTSPVKEPPTSQHHLEREIP